MNTNATLSAFACGLLVAMTVVPSVAGWTTADRDLDLAPLIDVNPGISVPVPPPSAPASTILAPNLPITLRKTDADTWTVITRPLASYFCTDGVSGAVINVEDLPYDLAVSSGTSFVTCTGSGPVMPACDGRFIVARNAEPTSDVPAKPLRAYTQCMIGAFASVNIPESGGFASDTNLLEKGKMPWSCVVSGAGAGSGAGNPGSVVMCGYVPP